jgi:hypothetical protein
MNTFTMQKTKRIKPNSPIANFCSASKKQHPNMSKKIEPCLKGHGVLFYELYINTCLT